MSFSVQQSEPEYKRFSVFGLMFKLFIVYFVLVFGGGTLINTKNATAIEVGRMMHMVTGVGPTISWAESNGYYKIATGLRALAGGAPAGSRAST